MFKENKYFKCYMAIITSAQTQCRVRDESIYYENHHIIPKSLGGSDDLSNRVLLTAKEHFVCHALLPKAVVNEHSAKMDYALFGMSRKNGTQKRYVNSRLYEEAKLRMSEHNSKSQSGKSNSQFGTIWIHSPSTTESKKIQKTDLHFWEAEGWVSGRYTPLRYFNNETERRIYQIHTEITAHERKLERLRRELSSIKAS